VRRLLRFVRRVAILLVVMVLVAAAVAVAVAWRRLPEHRGQARLAGLAAPVTVRRDELGVPHIEARSELDAWAAVGYCHAQDRFFQMELARRLVSGRLAELVGAAALPLDRENRVLGLARLARAQLDALPRPERDVLEAYSRGVNEGLAATGRPVEAILLGLEPEPWRPLDTLLVLKYMEKLLGLDGDELDRHRVAERVGPEVAAFVQDFQGMDATTILPDRAPRAPAPPAGPSGPSGPVPPGALAPEAVRGSNAWVVAGRLTKSGKPLLANDTHLAAAVPSIWYQAHVRFPGVDVVGMTIAGSPYCVVGHNARVAWGSTTLMADQVDYVRLELDRPGGLRFRGPEGWEPIETRTERIAVSGAAAERLDVRSTRFGPIVEEAGTTALARQWTVARTSRTVVAVHAFQRARSVAEWLDATRDFTSPGQGLVAADVEGHIAYKAAAAIPIRGTGDGSLPTDARDPRAAWRGILPPEALPAIVDPPGGFLVTANNQIGTDPGAMRITSTWAQPSRAERIHALLARGERLDVESMRRVQVDAVAPLARRLLAVLPEGPIRDPEARRAWAKLRRWDGRYVRGPEPGLFELLHRELRRAIFEDDVGEAWTEAMPGLLKVTGAYEFGAIPPEAMARDWVDDRRTPARETMPVVLERALRVALRRMRERFGEDPSAWGWERAHTLTLPHPLGRVRPLDRVFDVGPVPVRGGRYTPSATSGTEEDPFVTKSIPVFRMVVDLGDLGRSRIVNSSGQSGHRLSAHYADQLDTWRRGALFPMRWTPTDVRDHTEALLLLTSR